MQPLARQLLSFQHVRDVQHDSPARGEKKQCLTPLLEIGKKVLQSEVDTQVPAESIRQPKADSFNTPAMKSSSCKETQVKCQILNA